MNKTDFLTQLSVKLRERGIEEEVIVRQTAKLERYFTESDEEVSELIDENNDIDSIADEISILLRRRKGPESAGPELSDDNSSQEPLDETDAPPSPQTESSPDQPDAPLHTTASESDVPHNPDIVAENAHPIQTITPFHNTLDNLVPPTDLFENPQPDDENIVTPENTAPPSLGFFASIKAFFTLPERKALTEAERKGNRTFWILFALSAPVSISITVGILFLFGGTYLSLAALIIALIGGLVVVAAGGTALAVIGIIFGLTQLFQYVPIGLYEIGFGITIGGAAMFAGIVIYNTALRLIPYIMKKLSVFFVFLCKQAKKLFILAKGACIKL